MSCLHCMLQHFGEEICDIRGRAARPATLREEVRAAEDPGCQRCGAVHH